VCNGKGKIIAENIVENVILNPIRFDDVAERQHVLACLLLEPLTA